MSIRLTLARLLVEEKLTSFEVGYVMPCGFVLDVAFPKIKLGIVMDTFKEPESSPDWTIYTPSTNIVKCGMAVQMIIAFKKSLENNKLDMEQDKGR